ncbi:helix-turn-helix transcriptional regulator [Paraburkholderia sp. CNPSo 3076]|uniref:helix-turn-helix transcriptional regulator n=1 Tax=Paraburkholderia sp. CNPSo 3076 TaxID=2940936 RepID=UPI002252D3A4|nr:helix-turn-helix transcriptional regulator [Paraburkholderia sp. CNPSo 3076]
MEQGKHRPSMEQFIDETLNCFTRVTGAQALAFYTCGVHQEICYFERRGLPDAFHRLYVDEMYHLDPFDEHMVDFPDVDVALLSNHLGMHESHREYRQFLSMFRISNIIELVFRSEGHPQAGMSVCLPEACDDQAAASILAAARALHPYIGFNLAASSAIAEDDARANTGGRYGLSKREAQVAELVCRGFSNGDVASSLHVSVATVKTHLLHIFDKAGVTSRTALVSRLLASQ